MAQATCKICGNEFSAKRNDAMYCSDECKRQARRNQAAQPETRAKKNEKGRQYINRKRAENPEKYKEQYKQWYQTKGAGYHKQWRAKHPEWQEAARERARHQYDGKPELKKKHDAAHYRRHSERIKASNKAYQQENREKLRPSKQASLIRYRARLANATGDWKAEQFKELCESSNNHCWYCHKQFDKLTADHIIPLSRGGSNDITNIAPACLSCNAAKQARTPLEHHIRTSHN